MIALSNTDAERLVRHTCDYLEIIDRDYSRSKSLRKRNEVRLLRLLVEKVDRRLRQEKLNRNKQSNNTEYGKKI